METLYCIKERIRKGRKVEIITLIESVTLEIAREVLSTMGFENAYIEVQK